MKTLIALAILIVTFTAKAQTVLPFSGNVSAGTTVLSAARIQGATSITLTNGTTNAVVIGIYNNPTTNIWLKTITDMDGSNTVYVGPNGLMSLPFIVPPLKIEVVLIPRFLAGLTLTNNAAPGTTLGFLVQ